jgi:transmembrane sensor
MDVNKRRERASAEAAEWWLRFEAGEMSREHREEFVDWLRESALHVAELLRIAEVHGALEQFRDWAGVSTEGWDAPDSVVPFSQAHAAPASAIEPRRFTTRNRWLTGAAAAAVAAFALWFAIVPRAEVIETGRGERRGVTIADGSVIQIDPESRLSIRLEVDSRHVHLERGRALFRVAKDAKRPFFVDADSTVVRAVGTQFGVEQAREGVVVTVAEGKVSVLPQAVAMPRGVPSGLDASDDRAVAEGSAQLHESTRSRARGQAGREEVFLFAGQQVTVPKRGPTYPVRHVDSERELAWAAGRLVFENQSVAGVIEEFNRYNVVQLHVADAQLAGRTISGVFDASEPESFIGFIKSVVPVRVDRAGPDITISSAP